MDDSLNIDNIIDSVADQAGKKRAGRPNKGLTDIHRQKYIKEYAAEQKLFRHTKSPDTFNSDLVEAVTGEVVNIDDINQFKEFYQLTCYSLLDQFKQDNPELIEKHPYNWFKKLLLIIKKNVPAVYPDNIDRLGAVWDVLRDFLYDIGLYPTFELFSMLTNIYKYQLENRQALNPKYIDLLQKIEMDTQTGLVNELAINPFTQTNKIFLAKVHGIIEKQQPKQIEVTHNLRNYDNINRYRITENDNNN